MALPAQPLEHDRLVAARRALAEASSAAGLPAVVRKDARARRTAISTGLPALDTALGGGLPRGRIVEIVGARSSGRLSFTLSLLSRALATGEPVAFIDAADALDPRALHPDDRSRVLWVRPTDALAALKCADLVLDAGGFGVVVVYLVGVARVAGRDLERMGLHAARARDPAQSVDDVSRVTGRRGVGTGAWARIAQRAERAQSSVLVALDARSAHAPGTFAYASLEVRKHHAVWRGRKLLETVHGEIVVARSKMGAAAGVATEVIFHAG